MQAAVEGISDWPLPDGLSLPGQRAAEVILSFVQEHDLTSHHGGGRFYSPQEWANRGEHYGTDSHLVITHDGGDHARAFNWDYDAADLIEALRQKLEAIGLYVEQCTTWYSAVYGQLNS